MVNRHQCHLRICVSRYIQLVGWLLCAHCWLSIGGQPDRTVSVHRAHCPVTAAGCVWKRLELWLQHSPHTILRPQRLLLVSTNTWQGCRGTFMLSESYELPGWKYGKWNETASSAIQWIWHRAVEISLTSLLKGK